MKKKKRIKKSSLLIWTLVLSMVTSLFTFHMPVYAESFAKTGAYAGGTVTITPTSSGSSANGYSKIGGYNVTYSITGADFKAYETSNGSEFYVGNNLGATAGCSFWYAPSGTIWQDGILQLGAITDGKSVGSATADADAGSVSITYHVSSLSELPKYIGFAYQPAGGAYLHRSESYGHDHHIWYYHTLSDTAVTNTASFDTTSPSVTAVAKAAGDTVSVGGKTWGTKAVITATSSDAQSRPGNLYFYQGTTLKNQVANTANSTSLSASLQVTQNGTFSVKSDDKLGNLSSVTSVTVDMIDTTAPVIQTFGAKVDEDTVCKENTLTVLATDAGCGLSALPYKWNDGDWCSDSSFQVKENGIYKLTVRDALGNESEAAVEITNVDSKAPVIEKVEQTKISDEKIRVTVTACDNEGGVGLHEQAYSFDGGKTWQKENFLDVSENATYDIVVRDAYEQSVKHSETITGIKAKKDDSKKDDSDTPGGGDDGGSTDGGNDSGSSDQGDDKGNSDGGNSGGSNAETDDSTDSSDTGKNKKNSGNTGNKGKTASVSGNEILNGTSDFNNISETGDSLKNKKISATTSAYELDSLNAEHDPAAENEVTKAKGLKALSRTEKTILGVLAFLTIMGLAGLGTYLLLSYLQNTCLIYAVNDQRQRVKLGRFPIRIIKDEWNVILPADKMGTTGTGEFVFVFRPAFVKEEAPCDVILQIDQKKTREKLQEEIEVKDISF